MCGIAGYVTGSDSRPFAAFQAGALRPLAPRGPDDARCGPDCLTRLVGMFALAILDRDRKRLFLARDFFGIKPLYLARPAGGFAFASEIKALRPIVSGRVRPDRLFDYLRDGLTDHGG